MIMITRLHKDIFSKADFEQISAKISEVEKSTSGEIRLSIRHGRNWNERKLSLHELALGEFHRLCMQNTKERTGVLILLLISEKKFHIVADEGIHNNVKEGTWDEIAKNMSACFKEGSFLKGITEAIDSVGSVLKLHFPKNQLDKNELSNDVSIS